MNKKSSRKPFCWCFSQYVFRCGWTRQQTTTYSSFWKTSSQGFFAIYHTSIHFFLWEMFSEALTSMNRLRDSTDFETQLYLCNEAFKVWTLTPFNSSKTRYKIPHIQEYHSNFEAEACSTANFKTLPLQFKYFCQWLDWHTYHRLFSSSALPAYLLFALLVICALLRDTLQRWSLVPKSSATVGPFMWARNDEILFQEQNGAPPQITPRSQSHLRKKEEVIISFYGSKFQLQPKFWFILLIRGIS